MTYNLIFLKVHSFLSCHIKKGVMSHKFFKCYTTFRIAHFKVLCSVVRPLNRNEARVDFAMIKTSLLFKYILFCSMLNLAFMQRLGYVSNNCKMVYCLKEKSAKKFFLVQTIQAVGYQVETIWECFISFNRRKIVKKISCLSSESLTNVRVIRCNMTENLENICLVGRGTSETSRASQSIGIKHMQRTQAQWEQ